MFDAEAFGKAMGDAISAAVGPLKKEIEDLKMKLAEKPDFSKAIADEVNAAVSALPRPENGKDADMAAVQKMVVDAVAAIPKAKDGENGKSITIDDVRPMIGEAVRSAVAAIPVPKDGKDCDMVAVKTMLQEAVKALPPAKDGTNGINGTNGKDCDMVAVKSMVEEAVKSIEIPKGKDGKDGRDGTDGRDALEIDILPEVLAGKSYRHKTFARWRGGLIRAVRNTDPLMPGDDDVLEHGWSIVVNGVEGPVDKGLFDANFVKTFEAALND